MHGTAWFLLNMILALTTAQARLEVTSMALAKSTELVAILDPRCGSGVGDARAKAQSDLAAHGLTTKHKSFSPPEGAPYAIALKAERPLTATEQRELLASDCVRALGDNSAVQTAADPLRSEQVFLPVIRQTEAERLFHHPIWGARAQVVVAVVDTGIDLTHPDLAPVLWRGRNGERGYDFQNGDGDPSDDGGHGTHVAGLIGAVRGNGIGGQGVAGGVARLMPVKSQDAGGGATMVQLVNAIRWAVDNDAEIINLSLAAEGRNGVLEEVLDYALIRNVLIVTAAGNAGAEISDTNFVTPIAYARDAIGLLGVGSIDVHTGARSVFSNFSAQFVETSAPGSARPDGILSTFLNSGYARTEGTSMAAPLVSGAAALAMSFLKTHDVVYTNGTIEEILQASAAREATLSADFQLGRRLDLRRLALYLYSLAVVDATGGFDDE